MTKITYWGADNIHKNYKGSIEGTPIPHITFLWTEIVPGGDEELEKRKEEIQRTHERWSMSIPCSKEIKIYEEIKDYQEFDI